MLQLSELASSPRNQRGARDQRGAGDRQRVPSQEGGGPSPQMRAGAVGQNGRILSAQPQPPPMVEDDDSSDDDEDEDEVLQKDGTLQVNDPVPKPLRELQQRKGPGRPLPPTPDDDDTMRRAASGSQLAGGIQRMDSSPGLANNRSGLSAVGGGAGSSGQVMPDLLPQQSSGVVPPSGTKLLVSKNLLNVLICDLDQF